METVAPALAVAAAVWGVSMSLAPMLQIRMIRRRGSSEGVSAGHMTILCVGFMLWLAYGLSISNVPIVVTNMVALAVGTTTVVVIRRFRT